MRHWEQAVGKTDEWYTPKWLFDALDCRFDLDVAPATYAKGHVPANHGLGDGLADPWFGFVWMNPPFGPRNGLEPWLDRFFKHGNGIALTPDRTSAPWFQKWAPRANVIRFLRKVSFERPDGSRGAAPAGGTALWGCGDRATEVLLRARIGVAFAPVTCL